MIGSSTQHALCKRGTVILKGIWLGCALSLAASAAEPPSLAEVRNLASQPVERILAGTPVERVSRAQYRRVLADTRRPVIVFFYSNVDGESQRVATLVRYLVPDYAGRIRFCAVRVAKRGKPTAAKAAELARAYRLKSTPGILFYDNPGERLVLEQEEYIGPDFSEFRAPNMLFWRTYYRVAKNELDKLLAD